VRPLRIEFQAFGPYPERVEVDLTTLEHCGLFVVAGDTGTGKTTILDAMSYALYGSMPLKSSAEIRSHHAERGIRTEVKLTFRVGDETYIVERVPTQERRGKNASAEFVTERTNAHLTIVGDDSTEPVATGVTNVDAKIKELVGLSASQFQRVVLLPQAKVTEFLLADSKDREALLEQLFDGRLFDVIVDELKRRADEASSSVDDADRELRSHLSAAARELDLAETSLREPADPEDASGADHTAADADDEPSKPGESVGAADSDPEDDEPAPVDQATADLDPLDLRSRLVATEPALADLEQEDAAAADAATNAAAALSHAQSAADRFDQAVTLGAQIEGLRSQRPDAEEGAERARRSQHARPVVDATVSARAASDALTNSEEQVRLAREPIDRILLDLGAMPTDGSPEATRELLDGLRNQHRAQVAALAALDQAIAELEQSDRNRELLAQEVARHQQQVDADQNRLTVIDELLIPLAAQVADLAMLEQQVTVAESAITARRDLDEARVRAVEATNEASRLTAVHAEVLGRFVATSAPRLAAGLIADEPCPVCGSRDHPEPATSSGDEPVDQTDLDAAASARDAAVRVRQDAEIEERRITVELGEAATRTVDELEVSLADAKAAVEAAERAKSEQAKLTEERQAVEKRRTEAVLAATDTTGRLTEVDRQRETHTSTVENARINAADIDRAEVESLTGHLAGLDRLVPPLENAANEVRVATGAHQEAAARAADALERSGFASAADAQAVVIDIEVEGRLLQALETVTTEITRCTGRLETLEEQGVPEERPDVEAAESTNQRLAAIAERLRNRLHQVRSALDRTQDALDRHADVEAGSAGTRETLELLSRAHTVCKDGGGPKIPLKRWILARELERVTRAANEHLRAMTNGRYSLGVRPDTSDARRSQGLGLEVFDAETGQGRSTASLSGGEQFQASLALALGLADVVSQGGTGSGHRFEALFVDEGFGALDPDALDDAIETLQSLHATGRTIGVITHVEAMKERLHVGIQVERRPDGRGSRLTVLP